MSSRIGRLIIACGLPGSGKTTLAKKLEAERCAIRLSADEWMDALGVNLHDEAFRARTEELQWQLGQRLLALGLTVIIEWGTWGRSERDKLRLNARRIGAGAELHYLSAPPDVLFDRIRARGMESPPIEREQVDGWVKMIQEPTREELELFDSPETGPPGGIHRIGEARPVTLFVMVGLPGAGKTTVARQIEMEGRTLRLTPDEWMKPLFDASECDGKSDALEGRFISVARTVLRAGTDVVLDFGVWSKNERSALRFLAADVGAGCELRYVKADLDVQLERITQRAKTEPERSFVMTEDELLRFQVLFQEPDPVELTSTTIDPPPPSHSSWRSWMSDRWPTFEVTQQRLKETTKQT